MGRGHALTTALVPPARSADREPAAILLASGLVRVFFRSDRAGGPDLWSVSVDPTTSAVTVPIVVSLDPAADHAPRRSSAAAAWCCSTARTAACRTRGLGRDPFPSWTIA